VQAYVRSGGKQYRVEEGAVVTVGRLAGEPGSPVTQGDVLLVARGDALTAGGTVTAEIVAHEKGEKVKVLKYKNKTRYRKLSGQRSLTTKIKIRKIEA
jgi:large subunit ribosomal protein L21